MAITHNFLETEGFKPLASETSKAELVVNLADGTLWSEDGTGTIIPIATASTSSNSIVGDMKNTSLTPITQGMAITITGFSNLDGVAEVAAADKDVTFANAIAMEDIAVDAIGQGIMMGALEGMDTTTPGWVEGDLLYLGDNGAMVNVQPTTGLEQPLAYVLRESTTVGAIQVTVVRAKQQAPDVRFNATGNIVATDVQAAIEELDTEKAGLATTNTFTGANTFSTIPAFNGGTSGSTAPFTVDSTQKVTNLNADLLDGVTMGDLVRKTETATQTMSGNLSFPDNTGPILGTNGDSVIFHNDTNMLIRNNKGDFIFQDGLTADRLTVGRLTGDVTTTGNVILSNNKALGGNKSVTGVGTIAYVNASDELVLGDNATAAKVLSSTLDLTTTTATATTRTAGDNSTKLATTAYVDAAAGGKSWVNKWTGNQTTLVSVASWIGSGPTRFMVEFVSDVDDGDYVNGVVFCWKNFTHANTGLTYYNIGSGQPASFHNDLGNAASGSLVYDSQNAWTSTNIQLRETRVDEVNQYTLVSMVAIWVWE